MRFTWLMVLLAPSVLSLGAAAQEGPLDKSEPKGVAPEQIIQHFATKEKEFKEARDQYTYRQEVKVQTLDGNTVTGEYQEVFDVLFDDKGKRLENVVFAPQSSIENGGISITKEDLSDIRNRLPFVLTRKTSCIATSLTSHPRRSRRTGVTSRDASGWMTMIFKL